MIGYIILIIKKKYINNIKIIISLKINKGFKFIWSILLLILNGLDDFLIWRIIKWIIDIIIINIANIKCNEKKRLIKILLIKLLPQINNIIFFPIIGIMAKKFVITILAQ